LALAPTFREVAVATVVAQQAAAEAREAVVPKPQEAEVVAVAQQATAEAWIPEVQSFREATVARGPQMRKLLEAGVRKLREAAVPNLPEEPVLLPLAD
jgi:hypothetical protein